MATLSLDPKQIKAVCDLLQYRETANVQNATYKQIILQIYILLNYKLLYFNKEINEFLGIKQCKISGCRQNSIMSATTLGVLYSNMLSAWKKKGIKS
ncbi:hypothetical protein VspSTUT11_21040 [Vibrio sp. STUT-A11]|nr:hypothetical protein VspSTUT11_21040 [Vibrio sp. STUT-A11]